MANDNFVYKNESNRLVAAIIKTAKAIITPLYSNDSKTREELHEIINKDRDEFIRAINFPFNVAENHPINEVKHLIWEVESCCYVSTMKVYTINNIGTSIMERINLDITLQDVINESINKPIKELYLRDSGITSYREFLPLLEHIINIWGLCYYTLNINNNIKLYKKYRRELIASIDDLQKINFKTRDKYEIIQHLFSKYAPYQYYINVREIKDQDISDRLTEEIYSKIDFNILLNVIASENKEDYLSYVESIFPYIKEENIFKRGKHLDLYGLSGSTFRKLLFRDFNRFVRCWMRSYYFANTDRELTSGDLGHWEELNIIFKRLTDYKLLWGKKKQFIERELFDLELLNDDWLKMLCKLEGSWVDDELTLEAVEDFKTEIPRMINIISNIEKTEPALYLIDYFKKK